MKFIVLVFLALMTWGDGFCQKPPLDFDACMHWPRIEAPQVSPDGRFVCFIVEEGGSFTFTVRAVDGSYRLSMLGVKGGGFTPDARWLIFGKRGDSLGILNLATTELSWQLHVRSYKLGIDGQGEPRVGVPGEDIVRVEDLASGTERKYPGGVDLYFAGDGTGMVLKKKEEGWTSLYWTKGDSLRRIWRGYGAGPLVACPGRASFAFLASGAHKGDGRALWYFRPDFDTARQVLGDQAGAVEDGFMVATSELKFSRDGDRLFFGLKQVDESVATDSPVASVDIWNYKDEYLQPTQLAEGKDLAARTFQCVVDVDGRHGRRLEQEEDGLWGAGLLNGAGGDNYYLTETRVDYLRRVTAPQERPDIVLVSTRTGARTILVRRALTGERALFSAGGRYVVWYDMLKRAYFCYDLGKAEMHNISTGIPEPMYDELWDEAGPPNPYGFGAWTRGDKYILLYDRYDIWKVDPSGKEAPVNLTNGYGRRHRIRLRCARPELEADAQPIPLDTALVFAAFNEVRKWNGFYKERLSSASDPDSICMGPKVYFFPAVLGSGRPDFMVKAESAPVYLLKNMSATEFPNLVVTNDFMHFRPVSDLAPQKQFNWLTSEVISWRTLKGAIRQGILYKPEDFDPTEKYPVIFTYYERLADGVNEFRDAGLSTGQMNIPWFVSHGYLVCCPDVVFKVGDPGASAYNCIVSAAMWLRAKPWVDGKRMGLQGHSFGGYETNFVITKTDLFAAAAAAAGPSDWISDYGSLIAANPTDQEDYIESAQPRLGTTLWQDPRRYIRNSPLFGVENVRTPLLLMHNRQDGNVPWGQGLEFYLALKHTGKQVWMLQYDKGRHVVSNNADALDYTIRLTQFFDHYLKGAPAPEWMEKGIPGRYKGIKNGFSTVAK